MLRRNPDQTAAGKWFAALIALAVSVAFSAGFSSEAFAQDNNDEAASGSEKAGQKTAENKKAKDQDKPEPGDPDYWAKVRKIHTVQKREFQKVNRLGVSLYSGIIPNNIFERYYPVGVRLDYFILENIGLELSGSYNFKSPTSLEGVMTEPQGINASENGITIADTQVWHTNFGLVWSPFYGKTAFYDTAIGYFDLYLFGGAGMVVTETPDDQTLELKTSIKPEGVLGAGISFYMKNHLTFRADYRQFIFQKVSGVGGVANPSEVSLGVGYFF